MYAAPVFRRMVDVGVTLMPIRMGTCRKNACPEPSAIGLLSGVIRTNCTPGMTAMSK